MLIRMLRKQLPRRSRAISADELGKVLGSYHEW
jgi:hypothetical protein